jgi:hypothetical protein
MKTLKTEVNEMENKTNVVEQKEEAGAVVEKIWRCIWCRVFNW